MQAEEERKASEETAKKAAADKAAAEKGDNPVAFLTNLMTIKTPLQVATAAKELDVEGGPAGRISVLFEVRTTHPPPPPGAPYLYVQLLICTRIRTVVSAALQSC